MNHPVSYTIKYNVHILKKSGMKHICNETDNDSFVKRLEKKITFLCDQFGNDAPFVCVTGLLRLLVPSTTLTVQL